jgi:hypothetical protein
MEKLFACRGSSLVERRPEKAGVASSILAPGTIRIPRLSVNTALVTREPSLASIHFTAPWRIAEITHIIPSLN